MDNNVTFDNLPYAVEGLNERLERIENILKNQKIEQTPYAERMTVKEVAKYLDIAVQTIYGLVYRREIPHEKRGKRLYFVTKEIDLWLQKGKRMTLDEIKDDL